MAVTSPEYVPQTAPVAQPTTETQPPKQWRTAHIVAVAVSALVITVVAAAGITYAVARPAPKNFVSTCRDLVKVRLKAPATAKFPGGETVESSDAEATIAGSVDAQNGFGALIRGQYRCMLNKDSKGDWQISDVTFRQ